MKKVTKLFLVNFIIMSFFGMSYVEANDELYVDTNYDNFEEYQKWSELPDKENYLVPKVFTTPYVENITNKYDNYNLKASTLPSKFDPRETGTNHLDIKVGNQQNTSTCWAFAATNIVSLNLQKESIENEFIKLSTRHMDYSNSQSFNNNARNDHGYSRKTGNGGNAIMGLNYMISGYGPVLESKMQFIDNDWDKIDISSLDISDKPYKVNDYFCFPSIYKSYDSDGKVSNYYNSYSRSVEYDDNKVDNIRKNIKNQIMTYGGVTALTCLRQDPYTYEVDYFNSTNPYEAKSYYCYNTAEFANHAITIIGWDDNYSASNFSSTNPPKNDGAYIVLNSHGSSVYDNGFMYVSYDDYFIEQEIYGVANTSLKDYDNIYQYDPLGQRLTLSTGSSYYYMANVFDKKNTNEKKEYLNEIGIYVYQDSKIDLYANLASDDKSKITLVKECGTLKPGYHIITLDSPLEITGNKFVIGEKVYSSPGKSVPLPIEASMLSYCEYYKKTFKPSDEYYQNMLLAYSNDSWNTATGEAGQSFSTSEIYRSWSDLNDQISGGNFCIKAFTTVKEVTDIKVTGVSLNKNSLTLENGKSEKLIATVNPTNATNQNVSWSSSNSSVASVDSNGNVVAKATGSATITVQTADGNYKASCSVVVKSSSSNTNTNTNSNTNKTTNTNTNTNSNTNKTTNTNTNTKPSSVKLTFRDVSTNDWFYNPVKYVCENNIIKGYNDKEFGPNDNLTRGMLVTILYRMEGSPSITVKSKFNDVQNPNDYYYKAVIWAVSKGVVSGYNPTTFAPNDNITREQLAVMLNKYAKYKGKNSNVSADLGRFRDGNTTSDWARPQMKWAVGVGILSGNADGTLKPLGNATRAEAATMLQRYCEKIGR